MICILYHINSIGYDNSKESSDQATTKFALHADKKATAYFQDTIDIAGQIGANATLGRAYRYWGCVHQEKGDNNQAAECVSQAATYLRLCGSDKNFYFSQTTTLCPFFLTLRAEFYICLIYFV